MFSFDMQAFAIEEGGAPYQFALITDFNSLNFTDYFSGKSGYSAGAPTLGRKYFCNLNLIFQNQIFEPREQNNKRLDCF